MCALVCCFACLALPAPGRVGAAAGGGGCAGAGRCAGGDRGRGRRQIREDRDRRCRGRWVNRSGHARTITLDRQRDQAVHGGGHYPARTGTSDTLDRPGGAFAARALSWPRRSDHDQGTCSPIAADCPTRSVIRAVQAKSPWRPRELVAVSRRAPAAVRAGTRLFVLRTSTTSCSASSSKRSPTAALPWSCDTGYSGPCVYARRRYPTRPRVNVFCTGTSVRRT